MVHKTVVCVSETFGAVQLNTGIHDLPQDKQHKIREELAVKMFGRGEVFEPSTDKKTTGSVFDLLKLAMETIENLSKK